jgi:hypothetical protein
LIKSFGLIDKKNDDIYVATGDCLHDEIAVEINPDHRTDYPSYYYPIVGEFHKNVLTIRPSGASKLYPKDVAKIKMVMKDKTSFELKWENN